MTTGVPDTRVVNGIFTPTLLCMMGIGRTGSGSFYQNYGFATGPASRTNCGWYRELPSNSNFAARWDPLLTAILSKGQDDGAFNPSADGLIDVQSFNVDGFTLVCDQNWGAPVGEGLYNWLALDGFQAELGSFLEPVGGAPPFDQDITGLSFGQPDGLILMSARETLPGGAPINNTLNPIGFVGTAFDQAMLLNVTQAGALPRTLATYCRRGDAYANYIASAAGGALETRAQVTAWLPTGFRLNWLSTTPTIARPIDFIALKGLRVVTGAFTLDATLDAETVVSGLGGAPRATFCVGAMRATEDAAGVPDASTSTSIGAANSAQMACMFGNTPAKFVAHASRETYNVQPLNFANADSTRLRSLTAAGAVDGAYELTAVGGDGFTFTCRDSDTSNRFMVFASLIEVGGAFNAPHLGTD